MNKKIQVRVKTNSKIESVEADPQTVNGYIVRVRVLPVENQANLRVCELLAQFFKVPKTSIEMVSGHKSKNKVLLVKFKV